MKQKSKQLNLNTGARALPGRPMVVSRAKGLRPEFKRLLRDYGYRPIDIGRMIGTTGAAISMAVTRGYLSETLARRVEDATGGKYRAHLLMGRRK